MMSLSINGRSQPIDSIEQLSPYLDEMEHLSPLEAWLSISEGPSLSLLRQGRRAFLMYLPSNGDPGFTSRGADESAATEPFVLSNGQVDRYPINWCVALEECFHAFAYFCVNHGERYPHVSWHED